MKKIMLMLSLSLAAVATAVPAFAVGVVDYSTLGTSITSEITPALASALPIAGTLIAIGVGWKLVKKFTN
jgi:putative Mn2+ efflux pump MntP